MLLVIFTIFLLVTSLVTLSSKIRNELICDVLYRCKADEKWGIGFSKTYSYCKKKNIKVGCEKEIDGFWFIFYRNNDVINISNNIHNDLSEFERIILQKFRMTYMFLNIKLLKNMVDHLEQFKGLLTL